MAVTIKDLFINFISFFGKISLFLHQILRTLKEAPFFLSIIIKQISILSYRSLLPVCAVITAFGMVIAIQGMNIFKIFGASHMVSGLLSISLIRELSPCVTSIMVAAQAGSGIAAELGAMRIKEEIDALSVMSVNPLKYLVFPRLIGTMIATAIVNSIAQVCGIFGGYFISVYNKGLSKGAFFDSMISFTCMNDLISGTIKALIYGLVIGLFSTYYGFHVTGGAMGVGKAANNSVVHSILFFIFLNYILTSLFFHIL